VVKGEPVLPPYYRYTDVQHAIAYESSQQAESRQQVRVVLHVRAKFTSKSLRDDVAVLVSKLDLLYVLGSQVRASDEPYAAASLRDPLDAASGQRKASSRKIADRPVIPDGRA
ncbi:MAG TPA: hypothetical protein VF657_19060, partial [Actinoplanes sp.]|jgi:hypothetical protein